MLETLVNETKAMEPLLTVVASIVAPLILGWLFYLQRRVDKASDDNQASALQYQQKLAALEVSHHTQITAMQQEHTKQLMDMTTKFLDIHTSTVNHFVTKDDFHREMAGINKKLDRLDSHIHRSQTPSP